MRLTCLLIGQDTLLIQCGKLLLEQNHQIKWVVTPVPSIQSWCDEHHIPWVTSLSQLPVGKEQSVDYLFSIVNSKILTKADLKIARCASINYHDSLLPKYAGVNATTWSILNAEQYHGITWHLINEGIDKGDIVYQGSFPLTENETALTLNLRCFEEAVKGFSEILQKIKTSTLNPLIQHKENRSYYAINHVLPEMGFINWNTAVAQSLIRLSRALNFGNYPNNVGALKLYLKETFLIVLDIALSSRECTSKHGGLVLALDNEGLVLSTTTQPIVIKKLITSDGTVVTANDLTEIYGVAVNSHLPQITEQLLEKNTQTYKKALTHEKYWLEQIAHIKEHNFFTDRMFDEDHARNKLSSISFNNDLAITACNSETYLLASVMIYLYRINNYEPFTVFWHHQHEFNAAHLFSELLPLSSHDFHSELNVGQILELVDHKLKSLHQHKTYLNDIFVRQRSLESIAQESKKYVITIGEEAAENSLIHFSIKENAHEINIYHSLSHHYQGGTLAPVIANMSAHINNILHVLCSKPDTLIHQFSFLEKEEQAKLFTWSVGEYRPLPSNTITDLFEQHVKFSPENVVLFENNTPLSYHQLWMQVESITESLQSLHLDHESLIAITLAPGAEMLAMILGILKSGFVCVPIAPNASLDESSTIYKIDELLAKAHGGQRLERNTFNLSVGKQDCLGFYRQQSNLEVLNQKQIINYSYWLANTIHYSDQSILGIHSSTPFDLIITSVLSSLIVGGSLDFNDSASPVEYLRHLRQQKISHLRISAQQWELFLDYPDEVSQLRDLNYIVLTDSVSHTDQILKWRTLNPECRFIGITNTTC